jgi:MSHA biogenesis protein MshJ
MKHKLEQLLERIDALSTRERLFLFLSVFVCVLALADFSLFTPAQTAHKLMVQRFAAQSAELNRLRAELVTSGVPADSGKSVRHELAEAQSELDALNAQIAALAPKDQKGPALDLVLQRLLRRQEGLVLLSLDTLKPEADAVAAVASAAALPAGFSKRGLVLKVSGPYAELVRYVQALEAALPGLRWGAMELQADKRGTVLSLRVYALGVQL